MSLIICIYTSTGIVLSGDSRATHNIIRVAPDPKNPDQPSEVQTPNVLSDSAEKVFSVFDKYGVGTFGAAFVNSLPIAYYIEQFVQKNLENPPDTTADLSDALLEYFKKLDANLNVFFIVVGYDDNEPFVFAVNVVENSNKQANINKDSNIEYGIARGGECDIVNRLLSQKEFNPLFQVMNIQDAVDFSRHLIRSTIDQMRFEPRFATVGGDIDILLVTTEGAKFLQQKKIK